MSTCVWISRLCRVAIVGIVLAGLMMSLGQPAHADEPQSQVRPPDRLVIPSIHLDQTIESMGLIPVPVGAQTAYTWAVSRDRVGWHHGSALPGRPGNTVLSGHSDIYAQVFRDLEDVRFGDELVVYTGATPHRYRVTGKLLLQEKGVPLQTRIDNARWIAPTHDERLTLVTCARPGASHRLVVIARPVGD